MSGSSALVLGSGGVAGIAWQTGILHGLAQAGVDVSNADLLVGTSAGATVAAQLGSGIPVEDWFRRQADPTLQSEELFPAGVSMAELFQTMLRLIEEYPDPGERRRQIGALAVTADTVDESTRRAVIAGRLVGHNWPERDLSIVAVDATSGERRVFTANSGVDLVDAVAASSAVPGVWPPVTIGASRYIDGGMYSPCNADLATGYERVLVITPRTGPELDDEIALLGATSRTEVLKPDDESRAAFGANPLDPLVRSPSAQAGYAQGKKPAASLCALWPSQSA